MSPSPEKRQETAGKALAKALALLAFIILAVLLVRFTRLGEYFSPESIQHFLAWAGFWAPLAFIFSYAAGICLLIPGTVLTGIGGAVFGTARGFVYNWTGAMIGATAAFLIARTLGREFASRLVGEKLKKYDEAIERNGFATVLYLRLIYVPFSIMNFGMGLTKVRFWDYFFATGIGILAGTFILTFFIGAIREVWISGDWGGLISLRVFFSLGLFIASLLLPKVIKKLKGER
ncbi:MAG: TVP38/TMEM64 family protein [Syntrophobacteraceae bacterium]